MYIGVSFAKSSKGQKEAIWTMKDFRKGVG